MPTVPTGWVDQEKIRTSVRKAQRALEPDVVRIMFSYARDSEGENSLFFRVLLSDSASVPAKLRQTTQKIMQKVAQEVKAHELGLHVYFNFRSKSEQLMLKDPFWER